MEDKEHMITRYGELTKIIQQQEEDEAQKLVEKEQQAMESTPTSRDLIIVQSVLSLHHFLRFILLLLLNYIGKLSVPRYHMFLILHTMHLVLFKVTASQR